MFNTSNKIMSHHFIMPHVIILLDEINICGKFMYHLIENMNKGVVDTSEI